MSNDLQQNIFRWSVGTFGVRDPLPLVVRGNKEMAELLSAIQGDKMQPRDIAEECADVLFFLFQICEALGHDLLEMTELKLRINEQREWKMNPDGSYQHK